MIQYLINLTAIWLLSLVIYELLLGKESFHRYNRIYLLLTLLLGALLPLWQQKTEVKIFHTPAIERYREFTNASQDAVGQAMNTAYTANVNWVLIIYLAGVCIAVIAVLVDVFKLFGYYRNGKRTTLGIATIVETGKEHAPFSILNKVFVSGRDNYSDLEWNMLLEHELRHYKLLHMADLLLIQIMKIVFWFHPLVYVYYQRLMMVHEYQADSEYNTNAQVYGKFLIEQSLLHNAPQITHSFNRSPIKNRIIMLTKKSKKASMLKLLVVAPLVAGCLLCFTKTGYSYKRDGKNGNNVITFRGNTFEFGFDNDGMKKQNPKMIKSSTTDDGMVQKKTVILNKSDNSGKQALIKSSTGETMDVFIAAAPLKMNGNKIYSNDPGVTPAKYTGTGTLSMLVFKNAEEYLSQLNDGKYWVRMSYTVIDEKGKIVYYENKGIIASNDKTVLDAALEQKIDESFSKTMDEAPAFKPATYQGKTVPSYIPWGFEGTIVVKDHKATYQEPHYTKM
jgi:beta-lactamase regulating signal transducer with metallopeptidase domain